MNSVVLQDVRSVSLTEGLVARWLNRGRLDNAFKRTSDVFVALSLFALLLPVMTVVYCAVRFTSNGPALYAQKRLTARGRIFTMYKFRTMTLSAEQETGAVLAAKNDARVTPIGSFLRKSRLDELPQFLNVLIGDMSLIGPRPERPEIALTLQRQLPMMRRRLEVKAGLTGLAQVRSGYAACVESYRDKLEWDIRYIDERSPMLDLKIALQTIWVIFSGFGAR
jgi:lipopolysaccharide/colanic/teichoic acid biosynthesis glycosyltransferase